VAATGTAKSARRKQPLPARRYVASPGLALADETAAPAASPARDLQALLQTSVSDRPDGAWSARATLSFVVVVCGAFWLCTALLVQLVFR
jgi:hypothetical protein